MWYGIREESGENIVGTPEGIAKARTWKPKADLEFFNSIRGVPWEP